MFEEHIVPVSELRELYHQGDLDIEIDTPDGYQKIVSWWDKGVLPMVVVEGENGMLTRCAANHLLQKSTGQWVPAIELTAIDAILTTQGVTGVISVTPVGEEECYDFEVDHPNHRYWGDGFCRHNSGKSYIVSGNIVRDALAKGCYVILLDSEDALKETWMRNLGVDPDHPRLTKEVVSTVDEIASCVKEFTKSYVDSYKDTPREEQPKLLFVVDSLGVVQTQAEIDQFEKGELKGDKGIKAKTLKMLVANCIRLFSGYEIGMVATNHTYKSQDMYNPDDVISGGCLTAGTLVSLADGSKKPIEDMAIGDVVKTLFGEQSVTHVWQYEKPTYTLELADGQTVTCSPEHKFLVVTEEGQVWKTAEDITEYDELVILETPTII
jgi:hypothetical protein